MGDVSSLQNLFISVFIRKYSITGYISFISLVANDVLVSNNVLFIFEFMNVQIY